MRATLTEKMICNFFAYVRCRCVGVKQHAVRASKVSNALRDDKRKSGNTLFDEVIYFLLKCARLRNFSFRRNVTKPLYVNENPECSNPRLHPFTTRVVNVRRSKKKPPLGAAVHTLIRSPIGDLTRGNYFCHVRFL
jgi:hypothetical protein